MWPYLAFVVVALLTIKLVNVCLYWRNRGLPYEPFPRYLYRQLWLSNTNVLHDVLQRNVATYGPLYGTYRGTSPCLVVTDVEIAKDVLIKQFTGFFGRTFEFTTGDPLWDNTLSHLPYEQWKTVRTIMGYTFTTSKMKGMIAKINKVAARYADKLASVSKTNENEIEMRPLLYGSIVDSNAAVSFGVDINTLESPTNDFVKYGTQIFRTTISLTVAFLFGKLFKYIPFVDFPPRAASQFFGNIGKRIIAEKRKNLDEVIANGTADILDLHLIAQREDPKNHLTDELLASQAFLFFIGGVDLSTVTLRFCTYCLATNGDVQQRVFTEISTVLGERKDVQYEDVQKMKLVEACLLESLRIMPPLLLVDRIAGEDTQIAGIHIDKGTIIELPLPCIHNDPKYFSEPDKFLPDRFLKDGDVCSEAAAFLTFGSGPKSCIGRRLALMTMQVIIARILLEVRLDVCSQTPVPIEFKPGFNFVDPFLKPLVLRLTPRAASTHSS